MNLSLILSVYLVSYYIFFFSGGEQYIEMLLQTKFWFQADDNNGVCLISMKIMMTAFSILGK